MMRMLRSSLMKPRFHISGNAAASDNARAASEGPQLHARVCGPSVSASSSERTRKMDERRGKRELLVISYWLLGRRDGNTYGWFVISYWGVETLQSSCSFQAGTFLRKVRGVSREVVDERIKGTLSMRTLAEKGPFLRKARGVRLMMRRFRRCSVERTVSENGPCLRSKFHFAPLRKSTAGMVLTRMVKSSQSDQLSM